MSQPDEITTITIQLPFEMVREMWAGGNNSSVNGDADDLSNDLFEHSHSIMRALTMALLSPPEDGAFVADIEQAMRYHILNMERSHRLIELIRLALPPAWTPPPLRQEAAKTEAPE